MIRRLRIPILILLVGLGFSAIAQEKKKADVYRDYKTRSSQAPDGNVSQLLTEANQLKLNDRKQALDKIQEALGLSIATGDTRNEAKCYLLLGEINESIQEWKLALENYKTAAERLGRRATKEPDYRKAIFGQANMNLKLANLDEAISQFKTLQKMNLNEAESRQVRLGLSEVYLQQGRYDLASEVLQIEGGKMTRDDDHPDAQNQRAKILARSNEIESARKTIISSQNTLRQAPAAAGASPKPVDSDNASAAKEEVAEALHEQERYDDEIELRNQSIDLNLQKNNLPEVTKDKVGLSKALAAKGETSEAIRELQEAALMADTINNPKDQAKAFLTLADLYEKNGRQLQALSAYKKYSQAVGKAEAQEEIRLTEKADLIKKQKDIEELGKDISIGKQEETIERGIVQRQQLVIYGLIAILVIVAGASVFMYRSAQQSKVANQLLALKSLRSQMNPHFIFNALNSVNQFIAQNDERSANKFLAEFSRLMRLVLENSQEDFIPLTTEQEIISLYLKLEHYRFRDKFEYQIIMDESIDPEVIPIPPMLIQPYIENAVWHGLRYKEEKGHLLLRMSKNVAGMQVEIIDDGIGRKRSTAIKTENQKKHQSTGLKNIDERLRIINKVYGLRYQVDISDKNSDGTGTKVVIHVPENKTRRA